MANVAIYSGSAMAISGSTPFALYDTELAFKLDGPKIADWCASRLGYPVMDVELQDMQFHACFEEAVTEYAAQVNRFNIRDNLFNAKGESTNTNLTHQNIIPNQGKLIALSKQYGTEAGSGGNVDWKTGYITTATASVSSSNIPSGSWLQEYDLDAQAIFSQSIAGTDIEIKRIFHEQSPAATRHYDPQFGSNVALNSFGWGGSMAGVSYLSLPLYDDMLKIQQVEFNDTVRKSMYSFELINNKLKIHPVPTHAFKFYFQYIETAQRDNLITTSSVSDFSNIGYDNMTYASINGPGKQWIKKYTLALVKTVLGSIRSKFSSIPIPGAETSMDGDTLRSEGAAEAEILISTLREDLEQSSRRNTMERENELSTFQQEMLNKNPLNIYIG
tara:strand:+ start:908 stop:2071 length:1164 start_codon:yes stop_codon:yes gene_type:complete